MLGRIRPVRTALHLNSEGTRAKSIEGNSLYFCGEAKRCKDKCVHEVNRIIASDADVEKRLDDAE